MALTDYDKKNLSSTDQKKIQAATDKWNAANAKGDKAGMAAAAAEAAAVRNNAGYKTDSSGNYSGTYTPTSKLLSSGMGAISQANNIVNNLGVSTKNSIKDISSSSGGSNKNSQYTGSSTAVITNNSTQQAIKDKMNANSIAWWSADEAEKERLKAENQSLAAILGGSVTYDPATGTWSGAAEDVLGWTNEYEQKNQRPTEPERDPRIDELLSQILNRDDFSYDAMNDPLYQQYKQMYQREGDRAMKETMAEAAAGAGGMNTYAITAAQQANSYYNSQLNDRIPELYQLAYDMYLNDKESKMQDLGILQDMSDRQYNRYRDTMSDWYDDKNFAYKAYQDAVQQGNWQTEFDNNNYWKNKEFDYNNMWANKEWDYNVGRDAIADSRYEDETGYNRNQYDKESAEKKMMYFVDLGIMPSDEVIMQAGWDKADVERLVEEAKKKTLLSGKNSSGNSKYTYKDDDDDDEPEDVEINSLGLGIGPISDEAVLKLSNAGAVTIDSKGEVRWSNGYGPNNYKRALENPVTFPSSLF